MATINTRVARPSAPRKQTPARGESEEREQAGALEDLAEMKEQFDSIMIKRR
jgi:hypothetical protein